jgi:ornithine carbamoyltransferase
MRTQDFVSIRGFAPQQIGHFLDLAVQIKAMPEAYSGALRGKTLAMIFEKPSLRTRVTFDVGIHQLGGFALYLSPAEINLGKRESVYDVAKNLERECTRCPLFSLRRRFSAHTVPVITAAPLEEIR